MKAFVAKYTIIFFLAALITGMVASCSANGYKCSCEPLDCGAFDIQLQGGINPINWRSRGEFDTVNCVGFINPVVKIFDIPQFHTFFRLPWILGGQVGYAWSENTRIYLEFNYSQAHAKNHIALLTNNPLVVPPQTVTFVLNKYHLYDFYAGIRYYTNRYKHASLFIGGKVGLTHHAAVNLNTLTIAAPQLAPIIVVPPAPITRLFKHNNSVSGGFNIGLDYCFCENVSLVITGEVVASCGPKTNNNIVLMPSVVDIISATNVIVGAIETELRFPVTAGIRYSF